MPALTTTKGYRLRPGLWATLGCVVFGVVMTVGVAWIGAAQAQEHMHTNVFVTGRCFVREGGPFEPIAASTGGDFFEFVSDLEWSIDPPFEAPPPDVQFTRSHPMWTQVATGAAPELAGYADLSDLDDPETPDTVNHSAVFVGVPFRALRTDTLHRGGDYAKDLLQGHWNGGIPIGGLSIPIKPITFGFLMDTLLYAAIPWSIILLSRTLRARRRIRRNRCASCNYDTTNFTTCPECGQSVQRNPHRGEEPRAQARG